MIARLVLSRGRFKTANSRIGVAFVVRSSLRSFKQNKLTAKDLRNILKSHSELPGGTKADLVLKVYPLLMREILPSAATSDEIGGSGQRDEDFKYDSTMRRTSVLGWSTDLRNLSEMNFVQLYDYLVVSICKYRHNILKGTNYKKLKSHQIFFEGNVKKLECKGHNNKSYVRASLLPSMKKSAYRVVVEFSPTCDVLCAACTCPAGLGLGEVYNKTQNLV